MDKMDETPNGIVPNCQNRTKKDADSRHLVLLTEMLRNGKLVGNEQPIAQRAQPISLFYEKGRPFSPFLMLIRKGYDTGIYGKTVRERI